MITVNDTPPFGSPRIATATSVGSAITVAPIANSRGVVQTVSAYSEHSQATPKLTVLGGVHAIATTSAIRAAAIPAAAGCRRRTATVPGHQWPGDRDYEPFLSAGAAEPGLELRRNGEDHR